MFSTKHLLFYTRYTFLCFFLYFLCVFCLPLFIYTSIYTSICIYKHIDVHVYIYRGGRGHGTLLILQPPLPAGAFNIFPKAVFASGTYFFFLFGLVFVTFRTFCCCFCASSVHYENISALFGSLVVCFTFFVLVCLFLLFFLNFFFLLFF